MFELDHRFRLTRLQESDGVADFAPVSGRIYRLDQRVNEGVVDSIFRRNSNLKATAIRQANVWSTPFARVYGVLKCPYVQDCWIYKKDNPANRIAFVRANLGNVSGLIIIHAWQAHTSGDASRDHQDSEYVYIRQILDDPHFCLEVEQTIAREL
jgi:hypothetical protein